MMKMNAGARLGRFEVVSLLGTGGMGEVYLARDLQLGREVAIKIVSFAATLESSRLERFEREAQILASMSHPHVGSIFGLERHEGLPFLVLELVPGPTLDTWLAASPSMDDILRVFVEIAEGLEAAHSRGVVHRDLKPSNIKIRPAGGAKILDFGLAEVWSADEAPSEAGDTLELGSGAPYFLPLPSASDSGDSSSSDEAAAARPIVGTLAYMSPEQARGLGVTTQTDIWAFGCLLYEALAGRRAFGGDSSPDVLTAILEREPDWNRLPSRISPGLRLLIQRCLAKDPHCRLHHIGDVRLELQHVIGGVEEPPRRSRTRWAGFWAPTAALGVFATGAIGFLLFKPQRPESLRPETPSVKLLDVNLPDEAPVWLWWWRPVPALALSPEGRTIAWVADRGLGTQIYLRSLDGPDALALEGTEEGRHPFFSPDGRSLAFLSEDRLRIIELESKRVREVCAVTLESSGGSWSEDGWLYFSPSSTGGISRVRAEGGAPEAVTRLDAAAGERAHLWPEVLPGGKGLIYSIMTQAGLGESRLVAESLESHRRRLLAQGGAHARFIAPDRVIFADEGKLLALPFDPRELRPEGPARTVLEGVRTEATGAGQYGLARDGTLVYVPGTAELGDRTLAWVGSDGVTQPLSTPRRNYRAPRLSPDGRRVAVEVNDAGRNDIWIYDIERGTLSRLTFEGDNFAPVWTHDGREITFASDHEGGYEILSKPFDDSAPPRVLASSDHSLLPTSWSPDGKHLAYYERHPETQLDLWIWDAGTNKSEAFLRTPASELKPMFSPDGKWIAFSSDRTGRREVYIAPFPEGEPLLQVSREGGREPAWSPDGRAVVYREGESIVEVGIDYRALVELGPPQAVEGDGNANVWISEASGEGPAGGSGSPALSTAGRRLAGAAPIYRWVPPTPGGPEAWRREVVFQKGRELVAVELKSSRRARALAPRVICETRGDVADASPDFDIARSDGRLLMVQGGEEQPPATRLGVVLGDWAGAD